MTDRRCKGCEGNALGGSDYCAECEREIRECMKADEEEYEAYLERYDNEEP
jgi:hypothetical protein